MKRKRAAAEKACKNFLEAELVIVYGSVALKDILGFFSDIDMLFWEIFWFYGAALEATLRKDTFTGFLKIQEAAKMLLRVYLLNTKTLLRKSLPDNRGFSYLKSVKTPESLLTFLEKVFERKRAPLMHLT